MRMAHIISVLLALTPAPAEVHNYLLKVTTHSAGLARSLTEDKFTKCNGGDHPGGSFSEYCSEDIEKLNTVCFDNKKYTGNVLLVVNVASF